MRDHTTPLWKELTAQGLETITITPGTSAQAGTFNISGIPPVTGNERNYAQRFVGHLQTVLDTDAAGSAVSWDQLPKAMQSWQLQSPLLGDVFPAAHSRGAVIAHLAQVFALGGNYPQPARAQIPTNVDANYTIDLFYALSLSWNCFAKPHESAQWVGLFDQGTLTGTLDASNVLDGDYAGAVLAATTQLRAWVEYQPDKDAFLGVPIQIRERVIAGGGTSPVLKGVGQETGLVDVKQGCGLFGLFWLTDQTTIWGTNVSGPDGVDNFTGFECGWRGQPKTRNLDPFFIALEQAMPKRPGPLAGTGTTIMHDGAGWPETMAATPSNRPAASATKMFLPIIFPGLDFETSKAQRVLGDLQVNFDVTAAISGSHRFVSFELMEFQDSQIFRLFKAMGVDLSTRAYRLGRATLRKAPAEESKLRYTRILAVPA